MIYLLFALLVSPLVMLVTRLRCRRQINRILVIQTAKIGDLICATPLFREIKNRYPDAHLAVMVTPVTAPILASNPHVDELIPVSWKDYKGFSGRLRLARILRNHRFDAAVVLNPNLIFAFVTFLACIPHRLSLLPDRSGRTYRLASRLFTHLEPHKTGTLVLDAHMALLRSMDINSGSREKEVYWPDTAAIKVSELLGCDSGAIVGIGVSSANKLKELGTTKISELAELFLKREDTRVVLVGTGEDSEAARKITSTVFCSAGIIDATGKFSLAELPALLQRFSLYVGVDSGVTYMADALSVPVLNITGPTDVGEQRPLGEFAINIQESLACVPCSYVYRTSHICQRGDRACITSLSVSRAYEAAESLLAAGTASCKHSGL